MTILRPDQVNDWITAAKANAPSAVTSKWTKAG